MWSSSDDNDKHTLLHIWQLVCHAEAEFVGELGNSSLIGGDTMDEGGGGRRAEEGDFLMLKSSSPELPFMGGVLLLFSILRAA